MSLNNIIKNYSKIIDQSEIQKVNFKKFSIDTRTIKKGDIFVGLKGENFDGNEFYANALDKGAAAIVFDKRSFQSKMICGNQSFPYLVVDDCLTFLQEVSRQHVFEWKSGGGKVVCITGSNGKTTTKEMLYSILKTSFPNEVISTSGNYNNHIGVPLTLLSIEKKHRFAVVEIGTNSPGEILFLSQIAQPDLGIITSVGESHLEKLKDLEGVLKEKLSLFDYITHTSQAKKSCIYVESGILKRIRGLGYDVIVQDKNLIKNSDNNYTLKLSGENVVISNKFITGSHNFLNLSLATTAAFKLGSPIDSIQKSVQYFKPEDRRSEWRKFQHADIFCDFYNANPSSMEHSIKAFVEHVGDKLKSSLFIVGDMYELGEKSNFYHQELGCLMRSLGIGNVIYIGKFGHHFISGFGKKCETYVCSKEISLSKRLSKDIEFIFVKGSRRVDLDNIFIDDELIN